MAHLAVGSQLGRYEIIKHLVRGGMADISIARATGIEGFNAYFVLKHLRPEEADDEQFVQMFITEARLAGALHHHNIVQVHDVGADKGTHYFAMEYVHGEDLRTILARLSSRNEHAPFEHVVTIISATAAALHHAHERKGPDHEPLGIVHRDVTPANILVAYDGNVKVTDFGIAKASISHVKTQRGALRGKVPYMSPEQCIGQVVDRRSDVFGLGVVLYELVTTRRLFKAANEFQTMTSVIEGRIPLPSKFRSDLPKPLEAIILKALARKPAERFQTTDEMREALERFATTGGLRTSSATLAAYMTQLFGERLEPWMKGAPDVERRLDVDFDRTEPGLVPVPDEIETRAPEETLFARVRAATDAVTVRVRTDRDTAIVTPLPRPVSDRDTPIVVPLPRPNSNGASSEVLDVADLESRGLDKKWWIAAGIGALALAIGIGVVVTGQKVKPKPEPARDPSPEAQVAAPPAIDAAPEPERDAEPVPEPPAVAEPVAPPVVEVDAAVAIEPVIEIDAAPEPPPIVTKKDPPPTKPPAVRPKPPKPPKWDPDALFLKKKKP